MVHSTYVGRYSKYFALGVRVFLIVRLLSRTRRQGLFEILFSNIVEASLGYALASCVIAITVVSDGPEPKVIPVVVSRCQILDVAEFCILIRIGYVETSTSLFIHICIY
jgi:hypothetical protein